jgi:hypothetical protein
MKGGTKMPRWRMSLAAHGQIRLGARKKNEKVMDPWGQKNVGWINKMIDPTHFAKDFGAASPTDWNLG